MMSKQAKFIYLSIYLFILGISIVLPEKIYSLNYPNGTLIQQAGDYKVYLVENGQRRWIPDEQTFNARGYDWNNIKKLTPQQMTVIPEGTPLASVKSTAPPPKVSTSGSRPTEGSLIRQEGDSKVFIIENGKRRWIPDPETFNAKGYNWNRVQNITPQQMAMIPMGSQLQSVRSVVTPQPLPKPQFKNGTLVQQTGDYKVYLIENNQRRWIPDQETFNARGYNWNNIKKLTPQQLTVIPEGTPLASVKSTVPQPKVSTSGSRPTEGSLIRQEGDSKVFIIENGKRRWIPDPETFNAKGYNWNRVQNITPQQMAAVSQGPPLPSVKSSSLPITTNYATSAPQFPPQPAQQAPHQDINRMNAIKKVYRDALGREADTGGLNNYYSSGLSIDAIRQSIFNSEECRQGRSGECKQRYGQVQAQQQEKPLLPLVEHKLTDSPSNAEEEHLGRDLLHDNYEKVTLHYGEQCTDKKDCGKFYNEYHFAIDYRAQRPKPVYSPVRGVVPDKDGVDTDKNGNVNGYGRVAVKIDGTDDIYFLFLHLSRFDVKPGERIEVGTPIGLSGRTGANSYHLHVEVRKGSKKAQSYYKKKEGITTNLNPATFISRLPTYLTSITDPKALNGIQGTPANDKPVAANKSAAQPSSLGYIADDGTFVPTEKALDHGATVLSPFQRTKQGDISKKQPLVELSKTYDNAGSTPTVIPENHTIMDTTANLISPDPLQETDNNLQSADVHGQDLFPDGTLVRQTGDSKIYIVYYGVRHLIPDEKTFKSRGYNWTDVIEINPLQMTAIREGGAIRTAKIPQPELAEKLPNSSHKDETIKKTPNSYYTERETPVKKGHIIGYVGETGQWGGVHHVHFEVRTQAYAGKQDPLPFIQNGTFIIPTDSDELWCGYHKSINHPNPKNYCSSHDGIDIMTERYTPVRAAADGIIVVNHKRDSGTGGIYILIKHPGEVINYPKDLYTFYIHLEPLGIE